MKKLLFLLLLPFTILAQDGYVSHSYIDGDENGFAVGDTITVKVEWIDNTNITPDLIHIDLEWNNKLLELVDNTFDPSTLFPANTQTSWNNWTGYSFNDDDGVNDNDLDGQYNWWASGGNQSGVNIYPNSADWSVGRLTVQSSSTIPASTPLSYIRFKVRDRQGTNYANYDNITKINFANLQDIGDGSGIYDIQAGNQFISLNSISGVGAGSIKIVLNTPAKADHATDFGYSLYSSSQLTDGGYPDANELPIKNGNFDANGEAEITDLVIGETYWVHTHVNQFPEWLDEVLTVTDAYLIFKEAIGAGNSPGGQGGTFEYQIQYEIGEVTNSGNVDFEDSYVALAHINGIDPGSQWFTSVQNGAFNLSGDVATFGVASNEYYFGLKHTFTIEEGKVNYDFGHAFKGDPDFSHSYTPTAAGATTGNTSQSTSMAMSLTINALKDPIQSNLDIASELVEGKVHFTINLQEEGVIGTQFNIKYDDTILTLDNIIFDTGNQMTNFANHKENLAKVNIGSLDQNGDISIKTGNAYKLIFTPNQELQNTSGLITFKLTEGVKADGTKVKFNIQ